MVLLALWYSYLLGTSLSCSGTTPCMVLQDTFPVGTSAEESLEWIKNHDAGWNDKRLGTRPATFWPPRVFINDMNSSTWWNEFMTPSATLFYSFHIPALRIRFKGHYTLTPAMIGCFIHRVVSNYTQNSAVLFPFRPLLVALFRQEEITIDAGLRLQLVEQLKRPRRVHIRASVDHVQEPTPIDRAFKGTDSEPHAEPEQTSSDTATPENSRHHVHDPMDGADDSESGHESSFHDLPGGTGEGTVCIHVCSAFYHCLSRCALVKEAAMC